MGRILEALKQAEANRRRPAETAPIARPSPLEVEVAGASPDALKVSVDEEIPFIEVGGRRTPVDASPSVLAAGTKKAGKQQPPAIPVEPPSVTLVSSPVPAERGPAAVTFQPFPVAAPPLAPPQERFAPELVAFHQPTHPVSEQYRGLWQALTAQLPAGRPQVLLLTSAEPGAGTTTALLNLALTAARGGKPRVVVLDAQLHRPAVAGRLGLCSAPGLHEVLAGSASLQRALQETGQANLHALTAGEAGSGARLAGEAMRSVLRHLRTRFDLVLVDALPWDGRPEVVALGGFCDHVYLVVRHDEAQKPRIKDLLQLIPQQGGRLRGCILTQH